MITMIDKIPFSTNYTVPGIYGTELSYAQQLAHIVYKMNQVIDVVNAADVPKAVEDFIEQHPEYVTTVVDNSVSAAKLTPEVRSQLGFTTLENQTVTLASGNYIYRNCTINPIGIKGVTASQDSLAPITGHHIFYNCRFEDVLMQGSVASPATYELYGCTFKLFRFANTTGTVISGCVGEAIGGVGNNPNLLIEGNEITTTDRGCCVLAGGGIENKNIIIRNNRFTNTLISTDSVQREAINLHGGYDVIIENNVCHVADEQYYGIDINGASSTLTPRSDKVLVRNNVVNSSIVFYAAKNCVCEGNDVLEIIVAGTFLANTDYGTLDVYGNTAKWFKNAIPADTAASTTYVVNVQGNSFTKVPTHYQGRFAAASSVIPDGVTIYFLRNTITGRLCSEGWTDMFNAGRLVLPKKTLPIKALAGEIPLPYIYLIQSTISDVAAGQFMDNAIIVNNDTSNKLVGYYVISDCGKNAVTQNTWCQ